MSLGAAFWDQLFDSAESRALSAGARLRAAARARRERRAPARGLSLARRRPRRRRSCPARTTAGTSPPTAWPPSREHGGGFVLVSNSRDARGGASALRFGPDGEVRDAYRILSGTTQNCSGGGTPWGTWLSCEEIEDGRVWECDPAGRKRAVAHPAMGIFKHEAAAVDPRGRRVYLTEDLIDGGLYRYTPVRWPDLSAGLLEIARVQRRQRWSGSRCPIPSAARERTRRQVPRQRALQARRGPLARRPHALRVHHRRPARARLRHPRAAHPGGLRRARLGQRAAAAGRSADRLAGRGGVRVRGHRDRGDRHRPDRARRQRVEVPVGHRARSTAAPS